MYRLSLFFSLSLSLSFSLSLSDIDHDIPQFYIFVPFAFFSRDIAFVRKSRTENRDKRNRKEDYRHSRSNSIAESWVRVLPTFSSPSVSFLFFLFPIQIEFSRYPWRSKPRYFKYGYVSLLLPKVEWYTSSNGVLKASPICLSFFYCCSGIGVRDAIHKFPLIQDCPFSIHTISEMHNGKLYERCLSIWILFLYCLWNN